MKTDKNGLTLLNDNEGTYKGIIYDMEGGYYAVSGLTYTNKGDKSNYIIGHYEDARDAAFVSQRFARKYDNDDVKNLVRSGNFALMTNDFTQRVSIPEWKYPSVTEGSDGYDYVKMYVENPSTSLMEALDVFDVDFDRSYENITYTVNEIDKLFCSGTPLRRATRMVLGLT